MIKKKNLCNKCTMNIHSCHLIVLFELIVWTYSFVFGSNHLLRTFLCGSFVNFSEWVKYFNSKHFVSNYFPDVVLVLMSKLTCLAFAIQQWAMFTKTTRQIWSVSPYCSDFLFACSIKDSFHLKMKFCN